MVHVVLTLVLISTLIPLADSVRAKNRGIKVLRPYFREPFGEPRSLIGFGRIILCVTKRNPFDYNNYGCYCGWGGSGTPVDPIDECCQVHDNCYGECGEKGCWPKLTPYTFSCIAENRTAVCNHEMNTPCDSCACACDANAAHCFKKNDQYYHGKAVCKS